RYEALSWCWGQGPETGHVGIRKNGKLYAKPAKLDLVRALLVLRNTKKDRYLWVDQICINQANTAEKNHQVEMMAEIYGKAARVCVWLGERDNTSHLALTFIRDEVLKLQQFDDLCEREGNSHKWKALLDLMQRPWFHRRWVVQEISLAQSALMYCGPDRISWKKFSIAVELFVEVETATHRLSEVMKRDRKFHHIPGWFEHVSQLGASLLVDATGRLFRDHKSQYLSSQTIPTHRAKRVYDSDKEDLTESDHEYSEDELVDPYMTGQPLLSLEYLVSSLSIFDVTKAHDTIYALLAIARDTTPRATTSMDWEDHTQAALERFTQKKRYKVDYSQEYVDICQYFIQFCIDRSLQKDPSRALDVILRPWAVEESKVRENWLEERRKEEEERKRKKRLEAKIQINKNRSLYTAPNPKPWEDENPNLSRHAHIEIRRKEYVPLPSWVPQLSRAPFAMSQAAGVSGEKVGRANADPLVGLPNQFQRSYAAAETKKLDTKAFKFRKRMGEKLNYFSMFVKGFVLDEISEVKDASQSGSIPSEWADFAHWYGAKGDPPDAFWRTLVGDRGRDGKNPPVYYSRACRESFEKGGYLSGSVSTSDLIRNERVSVIAQFCWRVQAVIWKRALAKTKSNRLALVSPGVQPGDLVCVLYGCSVPVILHKSQR
ncbi:HET-domain-containing protein, partial [Rhizodiscina lignyota]